MRDLTEKARKIARRAAELSEKAMVLHAQAFGSNYGQHLAARAHEAAAYEHEKAFWIAREMAAADLAHEHREAIYHHHAHIRALAGAGPHIGKSSHDRHERVTGEPTHVETFQAKAVGHAGDILWQREGPSYIVLMREGDLSTLDKRTEINIRGQYTGDGARHPIGRGRLVAAREGGRWINFRD